MLPRFARYLADRLGWAVTASPSRGADAYYLMGYFEALLFPRWPAVPTAALFTHREEEPPGNAKARFYDAIAPKVDLRVAMCQLYAEPLRAFGPTIQPPLPVEQDRFVLADHAPRARPLVGFSGYTYRNGRKGEDLARALVTSPVGRRVEWTASGRGWPIAAGRYTWQDMPRFYQTLDVLVCPSRVEGGPMPVLEALACGVPVVVPRRVGLLDELPDVPGLCRYERGDHASLMHALECAAFPEAVVDREQLRHAIAAHTVEAWCAAHLAAFTRAVAERAA